jgi:hypothetical protein
MAVFTKEQKTLTENKITNIESKKELPYLIDDGKGGLRRLTTDDFIR